VSGKPREVLAQVDLVPPVVALGRKLGWSPLPLTVEEAEPFVRQMPGWGRVRPERDEGSLIPSVPAPADPSAAGTAQGSPVLEVRGLHFAYNGAPVLRGVDLTVHQGEFVALMGHNGAGKSTLLKQCVGLLKPGVGWVRVLGHDTREVAVEDLCRHVGYVPQNPNALLFADTIADELAFTRRARGLAAGGHGQPSAGEESGDLLRTLGLAGMEQRYPRDLSTGERQRVALAAVLVGDPELILLDEPTRGLDYLQKAALIAFLQEQRSVARQLRKTVLLVTHDVELVARCAERVIMLEDGQVVADGAARRVLGADLPLSRFPPFTSQIGMLFRDPRYLTVEDVVGGVGSKE